MLWNLSKKREQTMGEERALSRGWPITAHHLLWCLWSMTCNYNLNIRSASKGQRTYMSVVASWQKPSQVWYLNWSIQEKWPKWAVNVKSASRKNVGVFFLQTPVTMPRKRTIGTFRNCVKKSCVCRTMADWRIWIGFLQVRASIQPTDIVIIWRSWMWLINIPIIPHRAN